jgi:hypothetical protein
VTLLRSNLDRDAPICDFRDGSHDVLLIAMSECQPSKQNLSHQQN